MTAPATLEELRARYMALGHAMQSGIAMEMNYADRASATEPKHLRVGVNSAMVDHAAIVKLLIAKGIITEAEYLQALVDAMGEEVARYEARLTERLGSKVTLG